jgi:hypothetical protein
VVEHHVIYDCILPEEVEENSVSAEVWSGAPPERYFIDVTQGVFDNFRLLIQRPNSAGVFSGDFNNGAKSETDPLTALQRTFAGSIVPLEVFQVNTSLLSPHALCDYLRKFNPGEDWEFAIEVRQLMVNLLTRNDVQGDMPGTAIGGCASVSSSKSEPVTSPVILRSVSCIL